MKHHGEMYYYIVGEGFAPTLPEGVQPFARTMGGEITPQDQPNEERAFRFIRMFDLPPFRPSEDGLKALGEAMEDTASIKDHPSIPAGYTYLGQFIDHDITFDQTVDLPSGELTPEEIVQGRSPSLDLDSLYGRGPLREEKSIYAEDKVRLRIGNTTGTGFGNANFPLPNDLPRDEKSKAIIGDLRNDENLAVAQTHLAFLKAHNKLADNLSQNNLTGNQLFEEARRTLTLHYQWIVLHDFLRKIVQNTVIDDVLNNGRRFFKTTPGQEPAMPIEFSAAVHRFGHSMIRNQYEWNRVFQTDGPGPVGTLELLFQFTKESGDLGGLPTLPTNWIIDWRRFYDFQPTLPLHPKLNKIRLIDSSLALPLKTLPAFQSDPIPNLAKRNLLRGRLLGLPTGQSIAHAIGVSPLTETQITDGPHKNILETNGFGTQTPLWYYILKEAEVQEGGQRLGAVGSRILSEVFVGLIENSRVSILSDKAWRPTLPSRQSGQFEMADLLLFVNDLNPLGEMAGQALERELQPV